MKTRTILILLFFTHLYGAGSGKELACAADTPGGARAATLGGNGALQALQRSETLKRTMTTRRGAMCSLPEDKDDTDSAEEDDTPPPPPSTSPPPLSPRANPFANPTLADLPDVPAPADAQRALFTWHTPLPDVDCSLGEVVLGHQAVQNYNAKSRSLAVLTTAIVLYGGAKTGLAHALLPALFPRSGASSVVLWGLAGLAGSGAAWVGISYIRSLQVLGNAHGDLRRALSHMEQTEQALAELKENQTHVAERQELIEAKIQEAKENARRAREAMEATQQGVEQLVANIKNGLANAAHRDTVTALTGRVTELEALIQQMTLTQLQTATDQGPNVDDLARMAEELGQAAGRFERVEPTKKQTVAADAVREHKRKKGWKFW